MLSAGLSQIAVSDPQDSSKTDTKTGLTVAPGLIWTLKDNFQAGLVVGKDYLGPSAGQSWKYNGRTWVSFSVGYNFAK